MNDAATVIGGADGPTAIFVTRPVGASALTVFALLLAVLALLILAARLLRRDRTLAPLGAALVACADRYVKLLVTLSMEPGDTGTLLPGLFRLEFVRNFGAAWSSLSGARWLLVGVTAVGLGVLIFLVLRVVRHPLGVWSLWLVVGGGVGNLIDRVTRGYVVDMIATEFIDFPVFNVADIFVTCGTFAAAVYYLKYYETHDAKNWEKKKAHGTDPSDNGTGDEQAP